MTGNFYKLDYLACFDVFLVGVGPLLDERGRFYIFSKRVENRFPTKYEISDKLIAMAMLYGSSKNIFSTQVQHKKSYPELSRKPSLLCHDLPAQLSDQGQKIKNYKPPQPVKYVNLLHLVC